jgi:GAF domain-containing protein
MPRQARFFGFKGEEGLRASTNRRALMNTHEPETVAEAVTEAISAIDVLARALHIDDARLQPTLDVIVANAAAAHPAARDAGIILYTGGKLVPQATTGRAPQVLDLKQQETGDGPCIEAARNQALVLVADTGDEVRWPQFCAAAQACGVGSLLCTPLWVNERNLGALTLYSTKAGAFSPGDTRLISLFGTLAALALAEVQRTDQLREAISSRDLIGQAKGILMERHRLNGDAAFAVLSRASQTVNLKLTEVARHLAETGELLGAQPDRDGHPRD